MLAFKLGAILFIIALVITGPLLIIWALNTLFHFGIQYGLAEWFAVLILASVFRNNIEIKKD